MQVRFATVIEVREFNWSSSFDGLRMRTF